MAVLTGMVGQGFYDHNSTTQWNAIERLLPWLEEGLAEINFAGATTPIGLADFGCSEGRNSIALMQRLMPAIRARSSMPILTLHSDLPTNDYGALLRGLRSYGRSVFGDDIYSTIVGGSMYHQLLPPRSIHIAMTFNAIAFFSKRPLASLPDYIQPNGPSLRRGIGSVSEADRTVCAQQSMTDLEAFLQARAAELIPGGKLLIEVFGCGDDFRTCDGIFDALNDALLEVIDAGLIDRAAYERYYQPNYMRTLAELTAPVSNGGAFAPLYRLERAETYETPVPFVEDYRASGDLATYARHYTDFFRAFTEPILRTAFAGPHVDDLINDIYGRAERLVRDHPERYEFHWVSVAVLLTRNE